VDRGEVRDTFLTRSWGYDSAEVDDLLDRVAAELDAGRPAGPLIENATFRRGRGKNGYDVDAVDWFLGQILPQDHFEPTGSGADPWRGVGDVAQLVRDGVSGLAKRYPPPQKPTSRQTWEWFAGQCENAWRDFGQQPGVQLWWGQAGRALWELRTAEQQTLASLQGRLIYSMLWGRGPMVTALWRWESKTACVGQSSFTFRKMNPARSSSPVIAEIAARTAQDEDGHFAETTRRRRQPSVRGLVDETGIPILYASGKNFNRKTSFRVTFPDERWLRFLVRGTKRSNAIMTAVDQAGNKVAQYRISDRRSNLDRKFPFQFKGSVPVEIMVNPSWELTDELVLAIAISPDQLLRYFDSPD
jgi:DivIVA domain-containing protein